MKMYRVTVDGQIFTVHVEEILDRSEKVAAAGGAPDGKTASAQQSAKSISPSAGATFKVLAPMPGSIIELRVTEGKAVKEGDVLLVLEAMKMENEITAPRAGTVSALHVSAGDTVGSADLLVEIS